MKLGLKRLRFTAQGVLVAIAICGTSHAQVQSAPNPDSSSRASTIGGPSGGLAQTSWRHVDCLTPADHDQADLCEQRRQAQAAEDAVWWSRVQAIVATLGSIFLVWNLVYMRRSAEIGARANELNKQAFVTNQRAWLTTELTAQDDFLWRPSNLGGTVVVKISNIGKTPALEAHTNIRMVLSSDNVRDELKALCKESKRVTEFGRPVLPGESYNRRWYPHVDGPVIAATLAPRQSTVMPIVIGCVTYQILPDKTLHQTAFAYWVIPKSGGFELNKPVLRGDLMVEIHTGGFAD